MSLKVCFACIYPTNLFVSYILSKTVYKEDYKILILSDYIYSSEDIKRIYKLGIWDKVVLINEKDKTYNKRFEDNRDQLNNIGFSYIDIIHCYSFPQNSYVFNLLEYIPKDKKIILTVYSAATYYIKEQYNYFKQIVTYANVDLERVSEIWVYDKELYIGELLKRPLRNIELSLYIKNKENLKEICEDLNIIYNYDYKTYNYSIIFLDQPLSILGVSEDNEATLFENLLDIFKNDNLLVKLHPTSPKDKYDKFGIEVINGYVPWEVVLLNELKTQKSLSEKVLITYFSDTLLTSYLILNKVNVNMKMFRLYNLLKKRFKINIGNKMYEKFIKNFIEVHPYAFNDIGNLNELIERLGNCG